MSLLATALAVGVAPKARAATTAYDWDASGGAPLNDGAGSWNATGGTNWFNTTTSAYGAWSATPTLDEAVFGVGSGAADTVTVGTVTANQITFNAPGSGNYTLSGGTITLGGTAPTIMANVDATIGSTLAGSAGMTKAGAGTLTISSGAHTYTGGTAVNAGTLALTGASLSSLTTLASAVTVNNGGTFSMSGATGLSSGVTVNSGGIFNWNATTRAVDQGTGGNINIGTVNVASGGTLNISNTKPVSLGSNDALMNNQVLTGAGTVNQTGGGVVDWWNGTNLSGFTGTYNVQNGVMSIQADTAAFAQTKATVNLTASTGTLDLRTMSFGVDKLTGGGVVAGSFTSGLTLTVGTANGSSQFDGVIGSSSLGAAGASILLTKTGTGTFTLTHANTYTGTTTVNGGTLNLDFSASGAPATNIINNTANSSALTLGGGTLLLTGNANTTNSQRFNGLTLAAGGSTIQLAANATANPLLLTLGGIAHNTGGTVNFILPTGTQSGTNGITTTTANDATGILGTWAFVGSGANTRYAIVSGAGPNYNIDATGYIGGTTAADNAALGNSATTNYELQATTGAAPATVSVNTIRYTGGAGTTAPGATSFTVNGLMNAGTGLWTIGTNTLTIGANKELVVNTANADMAITGVIANNGGGASALTKAGAGTLTLNNAQNNTYSGNTFVNAGTLVEVTSSTGGWTRSSANTTIGSGGYLKLDMSAQTGASQANNIKTIAVNSGGTLELVGTIQNVDGSYLNTGSSITGTGTIIKTGVGVVETFATDSLSTFAGQINIVAGAFANNGRTWGGSASVDIASGAYLDLRTGTTAIDKLTGTGTVGSDYLQATTLSVGNNNGSSTFGGVIQNSLNGISLFAGSNAGGTVALTKNGTGTLTLTGTNTYSGATTVNSGILRAGAASTFSANSAVTLANTAGVALDLNGFNQTIGSLAGGGNSGGNILLGSATLTTGGNNTSTSYAGAIGGTGGLIKTGTGTFTLSGSNTYSGATRLNAGTLTLDYSTNDASKLSDTGALVLNSGTLTLSGGTHAETVGSVTINGAVNLARGAAGTSRISLGTYTNNGVLNVGTAGLATTTVANNGSGYLSNVLFGGNDFAKNDGAGNIVAANYAFTDVTRDASGTKVIPNAGGAVVRITDGTGGGSTNITIGAGTNDIDTLFQAATGGATTVDLTGGTLRLGANGRILSAGTNSALTLQNGTLTAGGAPSSAGTINILNASSSAITVNSVIADNGVGNKISLNTAGNVTLGGANTFAGGVTINGGTLTVGSANGLTSSNNVTLAANSTNATLAFTNASTTIGSLTVGANATGATINAANGPWGTTIAGTVTLNSSLTQTYAAGGSLSGVWFKGAIVDGTTHVAAGQDALIFDAAGRSGATYWEGDNSAANTFTGNVHIKNGAVLWQRFPASGGYTNMMLPTASLLIIDSGSSLTAANFNNNTVIETFDGLSGGGTLNGANVALAKLTININANNTANDSLRSFSGSIQNLTGALTFGGTGTQEFSGGNLNYTNNTVINSGTLKLTNTTAWGSAVTLSGGTLSFNNASLNGKAVTMNGGTLQWAAGNTQDVSSTVTMVAGKTAIFDTNGNNVTFASAIGGGTTASLTKTGAGTLTLSAANSYAGLTTISAGVLNIQNGSALGGTANGTVVSGTGAALELQGNITVGAEALTLNGTGVGGRGALRNVSGSNTYGGAITAATNATVAADAGSTLTLTGGLVKNGTVLTLSGGGTINVNSAISGTLANSDLVVDGTTANLNAANTYNGPTFIRNGGVLNANVAGALPVATRSAVTLDDSGTGSSVLNLGASQVVASLTGPASSSSVTLNANTLTIGTTAGSTTFQGAITGTGGNLTKDGASTQILSGANSYTGLTTVSAGTLLVNGTHAAGTGGYTVSGGTLGGTGTITSTGPIDTTGGQITGGTIGTIGTLTLDGNGTRTLAGTYLFDVNYGTQTGDLLNITGASSVDLDFGGTGKFKLNTAGAPAAGAHYAIKIFQSDITVAGVAGGQSNYAGSVEGLASYQSIVTWDGGKTYYLVPEPASFMLLGLGSLLLLRRPGRRRKSAMA